MLFRANNDSQAVSVTSLIILFLCMYFLSNNDSQAVSVTSLIILCMYFVFSILAHVDVILPPSVFFDVEMAPVAASVAASVAAGAAGDAPDASSAAPPSALVQQLSFYFSDANLRRDRFLLNHTGQNGLGEVAISTLASFNRVKALTTDESLIVRRALQEVIYYIYIINT